MSNLEERIKQYNFLNPQIEENETIFCTISYCDSSFTLKNVSFYICYDGKAEEICNRIIDENFPEVSSVTDVVFNFEKGDFADLALSGQKPSLRIESFQAYL